MDWDSLFVIVSAFYGVVFTVAGVTSLTRGVPSPSAALGPAWLLLAVVKIRNPEGWSGAPLRDRVVFGGSFIVLFVAALFLHAMRFSLLP